MDRLMRNQLEDIKKCSDISCKECSFFDDCDCGAKSRVASEALLLMDEKEKLEKLLKNIKPALQYVKNKGVNDVPYECCQYCDYLKECEDIPGTTCRVDKAFEAIEGMV